MIKLLLSQMATVVCQAVVEVVGGIFNQRIRELEQHASQQQMQLSEIYEWNARLARRVYGLERERLTMLALLRVKPPTPQDLQQFATQYLTLEEARTIIAQDKETRQGAQ